MRRVLNRFGGHDEHGACPAGQTKDRQRISGKLRRKFMSVPGLRHIPGSPSPKRLSTHLRLLAAVSRPQKGSAPAASDCTSQAKSCTTRKACGYNQIKDLWDGKALHRSVQWGLLREGNAPGDFGIIAAANRVILEQEGNDAGVNDDLGHAAGSVRLWPRHWWRVSRKSSMDSSSGQKARYYTETPVIGPVPCSAISCSTDGCPEGE